MSGYDIELDRAKEDPLNIILDHILPNSRILEFGCANGRMTRYMSTVLNCRVDIVEYDKELFSKAKKYAVRGICGDILEYKWLRAFCDETYDYIIFADVLEHLSAPQTVLEKCRDLLKDTGIIWISVPNIAHNDIIINLFKNKFNYSETGLLDKSHIHFFTEQTAEEMFINAGYHVSYKDGIFKQTFCSEQLLMEKIPWEKYYDEIIHRNHGELYQCIFALSKAESSIVNLPWFHHYDNEKKYYERRIYFDYGSGYQSGITTRESCDNSVLEIDISLSGNMQMVWICPAFRKRFIIQNLRIFSDDCPIDYCHITAEKVDNKYFFNSLEGGIYIDNFQGCSNLKITGTIYFDIDFEKINENDITKNLFALQEKLAIQKECLKVKELQLNRRLRTEKWRNHNNISHFSNNKSRKRWLN